MVAIEDILVSATQEERRALAEVLSSWSHSPDALLKAFEKRSLNIFQRFAGSTRTYQQILVTVAAVHGIRRRFFETDDDLERRLIRSVANNALSKMSAGQRDKYVREMVPHAVGAGGIVLAQVSGFGIYQMSSTVVGALTAAAGLKLPFLAYLAMSKAISIAIGPIGWIGLGVGVLHTLTKPDYDRLVAAIACVCMVRQRIYPTWEWRGYSKTEIIRKSLKSLFVALVLAWLTWARHT